MTWIPLEQFELNEMIQAGSERRAARLRCGEQRSLPSWDAGVQEGQDLQGPGPGGEVDKLRHVHEI